MRATLFICSNRAAIMVQKGEFGMDFLLTFLEGLASFVSPCILPMIPLYLSYFAGDDESESEPQTPVADANAETAVEQGGVNETVSNPDAETILADKDLAFETDDNNNLVAHANADSATAIKQVVADIEATNNEKQTAVADVSNVGEGDEIVSDKAAAGEIALPNTEKKKANKKKYRVLVMSLFFVLGFTLMFIVFGGLVGLVSGYIAKYKKIINIVAGVIVIIFGLSYIGLFRLPFFKGIRKTYKIKSVWSAFLFGIVFAVGVGPCTGAFLGSALALASTSGTVVKGIVLLLCYSLGIGIPFIVTAVLTDKTKKLFGFIKRHFKVIKIISGSLLVVMGVLMATGVMDKLGALLR